MTKFKIHIPNKLHYSMTTHNNRKDSCQGFYDNIAKFPNVVEGMRIEVKMVYLTRLVRYVLRENFLRVERDNLTHV